MLKKASFIIIVFFSFAFAQAPADFQEKENGFIAPRLKEERRKAAETEKNFVRRRHNGRALPGREKLIFNVMWKFMAVGEASLQLRGFADIGGRKAHHIYSYAKTKPFFDSVFKVRDINQSWLDEESKVSLKYASNISEGGWNKNETLYFDQIHHTYLLNDNGKMKKGPASENVQDVLSALYFIRTLDIKAGKSYVLDAHSGDMSWPLTVKVLKKEKIKVPAGEFKCLALEPVIRKDSGIVNAQGKMLVWVTDDEIKMPVYLKVKIPILGFVEAKLISVKNADMESVMTENVNGK